LILSGSNERASAESTRGTEDEPMRALTWYGEQDVRIDDVPEPEIVNPTDAIIESSSSEAVPSGFPSVLFAMTLGGNPRQ